jgi:hypothetical protein
MAVGAVNSTSSTDVVAINQISNLTRLGLAKELSDGKLSNVVLLDINNGHSTKDTNAKPPTIIVQGIDYFTPGYKIAILDNKIVAATIPGKNYIALFKKDAVLFGWEELGTLTTPGDISALDTITIGGRKQLVYVSGHNLYLQDASLGSISTKLGIVGDSQAIAVGDLNNDSILDIAVADYQQNLHVFILDTAGKVKESQTSKINTKPRDIT